MFGAPPNCRPECIHNSDCPSNRACINENCQDPCVGSCGSNTHCIVQNHRPQCQCMEGYTGDPYSGCGIKQSEYIFLFCCADIFSIFLVCCFYMLCFSYSIILSQIKNIDTPIEIYRPCDPSPCGENAICTEKNGAGSCSCMPDYYGDPYISCRPECILATDCDRSKTCFNTKCVDPCPGSCGLNADCRVVYHSPTCSCKPGFTGNPTQYCREIPLSKFQIVEKEFCLNYNHNYKSVQAEPIDPCNPSPCGLYSNCHVIDGRAVCSCQSGFYGTPPNCRYECTTHSDCPMNKACINYKCTDPCNGVCGDNAICRTINHNPICTCASGFEGDPFVRCSIESKIHLYFVE
jgi:hypothetical protein